MPRTHVMTFENDDGSQLIVELDGPTAECDTQFDQVKEICDRHGCTRLHIAGSVDERAAIWRGLRPMSA